MPDVNIDTIKQKLSEIHDGDEQQLSVIFSNQNRIIVEAPAGYGKTTTMISRIAYLFASNQIPNPKRVLGLTFSVNAALKVKREVSEKLPALIQAQNNPSIVTEKAVITNYHGFCKMVLKKYGYLLDTVLRKDVNDLIAIGESEISRIPDLKLLFSQDELKIINGIDVEIKQAVFPEKYQEYNSLIVEKLIPKGYITHNAVILLTIALFVKLPEVKKFYQNYFTLLIIDEFQDTNIIAWELIKQQITDKTKLLFLGDPLQRIYGFIGAISNIMQIAAEEYQMKSIPLTQNYRFKDNSGMLLLDKNIRKNAETGFSCCFSDNDIAPLKAFWGNTPQNEGVQIIEKVQAIMNEEPNEKIAILCRSRNKNFEIIEKLLNEKSIDYFYGVFKDDDPEYIVFHKYCLRLFTSRFSMSKRINSRNLQSFIDETKNHFYDKGVIFQSLSRLLEALIRKVSIDYATLSAEDKYIYLQDIFENRQLKQAMEYIDSSIILTTIHGAKGLEWTYVFLPDLERWIFPGYFVCKNCNNKNSNCIKHKCKLPDNMDTTFENVMLDELSVFYVGVTRARKQAFVSASAERIDAHGNPISSNFSCLASLNGVKLKDANR